LTRAQAARAQVGGRRPDGRPSRRRADPARPGHDDHRRLHGSGGREGIWALRLATNEVTVYSPICTHLGCGYRWDAGEKEFKCPCHGSVFDLNGKVVGGPAPRSLDRLPVKIENGHLLVQYKEFKSGTKQQIEI